MSRVGACLAAAGALTLSWSAFCAHRSHQEEASIAAAADAVHLLVEAGLDARPAQIEAAGTRSAAALALWPTEEAAGAARLVEVWRLGVLGGGSRDPRRFDAILDVLDTSLPGRAAWELAALARCRLEEECPAVEAAFPLLVADLGGTRWEGLRAPLTHAWLGLWVERGYETGSGVAWTHVRAGCLAAPEQLDESSPDDVLGLCLAAAGALVDYEQWFAWAHRVRRSEVVAPWGLDEARLHRVFTTASPGCRDLGLRMSGRWGKLVPEVVTAEHGFCYAAGMLALGCQHEAAEVIASGRQVYPGAPWSEMTGAYTPAGGRCYLDGG